MSEHASPTAGAGGQVTLETGLEALQSSPEFHGPVESLDGHDCNDHFAHVYETREEKLAAAVPFIRHGLERDERIMYVVDESTETDVTAALRDGGIDVDAALDAGALSFHTVQETYLRNGSFDPDEMIDFYSETVSEATAEYGGLRIVAEMTWLQDDANTVEQFMEYEQKVNELFTETDSLAICQYNRDLFAPEVIRNVVRTHPHLIYDGAACHNVYYTPPEEFFGDDAPAQENDRMLRTLRERTEAKAELQQRERYQQELYETVADPQASFEAKLADLLELGCERFGLEIGYATRTEDDDTFEIVEVVGDHDLLEPNVTDTLCDTYCEKLLASPGSVSVRDAADAGWTDDPAYERYGLDAYFATTVHVGGDEYGTLCFASETPRDRPYTEAERTFLDLMGQWVEYELERQQRERFLRESYHVTSDPSLDFTEKLRQLLDLGRDWMGLDAGGLTYLPSRDGEFLTEYAVGYGDGTVDESDDMWTDPGEGTFCRQVITADEPVGMADVRGTDWEEEEIHREHGLTSYLGTKVTSGAIPYGTLWVGSTEPRDREFSDTERTFLDLIGQWVSYEVERRDHKYAQQRLYEITADSDLTTDEKIQRLLEVGCEHLDLPVGMLNHDYGDALEIQQMHGTHPDVDAGSLIRPSAGHYCRQTVDTGDPITVADTEAAGWASDPLYTELGIECYAGVQLTVDGQTYGTICFTDLKPRQVEFTEAEQTFLELMGRCVSYELEQTNREAQLQQRNDRLESFASMLAHELRNPVSIGQIYGQQLPTETDDEAVEYVVEAFDRIEDMIDVMLVLTRGCEAVDERSPIQLPDVVREMWEDVDTPDAELEVEIDDTIQADETYVRHLFRNLLENAVEHGGSDVTVTVGELPGGFYVADDGTGIPAEDRDAVFEAGYTTAADAGGTGLGLAFVQKLAEVYEWECAVTDSESGGARFEFRVDEQ